MKSSKILSLAVASVLGSTMSGVALAIDLDDPSAVFYASELVSAEKGSEITFSDTVDTKIGTALPALGDPRFVRIALSGAVFADDTASTGSAVAAVGAACADVGLQIEQGGTTGTGAIALNITSDTGCAQADQISFDFGGATLKMTGGDIQFTYTVYSTVDCAIDPTGCKALYTQGPVTYGKLRQATTLTQENTNSNPVATVKADYKQFDTNAANVDDGVTAVLGEVYLDVPRDSTGTEIAINDASSSAITDLSSILSTKSTLVVTGDFAAAASVMLADDCVAPSSKLDGVIDVAKTSVTFKLDDTAGVGAELIDGTLASLTLCFVADGSTEIPASGYSMTLNPVAVAATVDVTGVKESESMKSIVRDGVVLRSGFISKAMMQVSRIIIANTSASDATISTVKFYGNKNGDIAQPTLKLALPYTLKAGSRTAIEMADLVDLATMPLQNTMVELQIGADNDNIFGTYQLLLGGSTVQTVVPMERPASAFMPTAK